MAAQSKESEAGSDKGKNACGVTNFEHRDISKYSRQDLERYYRWQAETLKAFRDKFGVASNCQALDAIDALKQRLASVSQPEPRWISVSPQTMPELGKPVLFVGPETLPGIVVRGSYQGKQGWRSDMDCWYVRPTHWQELPAAPRAGERGSRG